MIVEKSITAHRSMRNILNLTWGLKEAGIFLDPARLPLSSWMGCKTPKTGQSPWRHNNIYIPFIVLNTQFEFQVMELTD